MKHYILGLHHVTATVDDAQDDVDFSAGALGLRLVKKTVNFDNHLVYHFYYGDEHGTPGTIWTTFPYKGHGVPAGRKGSGQISTTSFSVPAGSFAEWRNRLGERCIAVTDLEDRFGDAVMACADNSGLEFELIANKNDHRRPWLAGGLGAESAIRGLHSVTMVVRVKEPTLEFLTGTLGYHVMDTDGARTRVGVHGGGPGRIVDVVEAPEMPAGANGIGTVHHVAMAVATAEQQLEMRRVLHDAGVRVTEVRDRCYFTSIYFREPGGVLFEIATVKPGFTVDEELAALGTSLKLPPWEEASRRQIESGLDEVVVPS